MLFDSRSQKKMNNVNFISVADKYICLTPYRDHTQQQKYWAHFGISADVTSILWILLAKKIDIATEPKHILWILFILKVLWT